MEVSDIPVLETERLRLRAFRLGDFEGYAAMCGDPEVARYLTTRFDREQAWRHLAFLIGHWVLRGFGMWAVEERETARSRSAGSKGSTSYSSPSLIVRTRN